MEKMTTLDHTDKKILLSLIKKSRATITSISKETHLSREIVSYRMSKLEEEKIITGYIARINQPLFCSGVALVNCKLIRSNAQRFNEIISFIKNNASINWCIETCGSSDLALTILYNTPKDLADTVTALSNFIGHNLKEHKISLYIDEYKFDRSGIITEKASAYSKHKVVTFDKSENKILDDIDIKIISMLAKNCRTKNIDMAKSFHVSEDIIRLRIRNLEKRQIITGYTISVDADKLGFEAYQMSINIEQMTDSVINKVKYYVQTNPYIVFCARTSGKYNLTLNIHAKNRIHFNEILLDIRNALPEIIDYEFQMDLKTHKEVFVPEEKIKIYKTLI
jgi:Lrp/AsnC family transcriptional regulator, regulator for asnA, asnC and gidA